MAEPVGFFSPSFYFFLFLFYKLPGDSMYNLSSVGRNGLGEFKHCFTSLGKWTIFLGSFMEISVRSCGTINRLDNWYEFMSFQDPERIIKIKTLNKMAQSTS